MSLRCLMLVVIFVFIATEAVSGEGVMKAVGDQVSFRPNNFVPPVTSIIWKHINTSGTAVKAIEWDEAETGYLIPNPRFKGEYVMKAVGDQVSFRPDTFPDVHSLTSIIWKHRSSSGILVKAIKWDEGEILVPNQRFRDITTVNEKTGQITITNLKVEHSGVYTIYINSKEQQQRFNLTVMERVPEPEKSEVNPDVVHLRCEYSDKTKKSTREELKCSEQHPTGESITVKNE
ncbi:uncharacterized protein LOC125272909 isoform X3 [Megalobrama amblycephala]|uniref:uncharacterized protein LOC125272909 isoform X3 n=1 Tax=Megalobrama amblycephala TaxID=75352 RepID=UPI0020140E77|nr:uncharacterized protein LOC125272909 isoform X3 [Megalobrama amblycephala]